ncbi:PSD1 and planctomycete cytochrome C domain-containing protein [Haloferula sp.]|uniref:PSD1 and planctomycete cytochrome C domain-containing protein n=1 Tax=Haloferula sp. TaxID=2497595 RepID=UPI003C72C057
MIRAALLILPCWAIGVSSGEEIERLDFGRHIQPILSDKCYTCHGPDEGTREADLRLDQRDSVTAGGKIAAIVAGDPEASELIERIYTSDADELMPPPKVKKPLTEVEKELLVRWIKEGAEYSAHWSFEPIRNPTPPTLASQESVVNPIDHFVRAQLEKNEIQPASEGSREMYLRRVSLDLTGLPPTVEELDAFLSDTSPNAYEKVVDRLLASDDHAERMAAVWLDNARYADSNGYQFDNARTMWPWRDWVIRAFKANMPYDQFVRDQLAGDLLEAPTQDQLIATGFNRNHGYSIEGGILDEEYRVTYANDKTATSGTLFLALTMDCTRCHDHKYDPLSMKDYYSFFAFFNTSAEVGAPGEKGRKEKAAAPFVDYESEHGKVRAMVMKEQPRQSFILNQGLFDQPGEKVDPETPEVLPGFEGYAPNRLGLSQWLVADDNPLFARVTVNRIWYQFFGMGLVKTVDNFGLQGEAPSHPELLDWLASDFRDQGWDLRRLIRQVVLSATYRQDSKQRPELDDPENRLLARGPSFRLPAETIRDQALAVSGLLTQQVGGPSVRPYQPEGIWEDLNAPPSHRETYTPSKGKDLYRKSMYSYWRRAAMNPGMVVFDAPNRDVCTVERPVTNTPLQALALMHAPTYVESARKLAERVALEVEGDSTAQIEGAVRRVLARSASAKEVDLLSGLYKGRLAHYQADPEAAKSLLEVGESGVADGVDVAHLAAMSDVCLAVFNLSETVTRK